MVDASYGGAFMNKSEDEAYTLFEILSENSINHTSLSFYQTWIGIRKFKHLESSPKTDSNLINKVDFLAQKLDQVLTLGQQSPT